MGLSCLRDRINQIIIAFTGSDITTTDSTDNGADDDTEKKKHVYYLAMFLSWNVDLSWDFFIVSKGILAMFDVITWLKRGIALSYLTCIYYCVALEINLRNNCTALKTMLISVETQCCSRVPKVGRIWFSRHVSRNYKRKGRNKTDIITKSQMTQCMAIEIYGVTGVWCVEKGLRNVIYKCTYWLEI